ncbi:hypothetical protein B0H14DRAFT_3700703 [Mycena olivaceomarginata]|nr:hypothetical protein B0H14DRAFT_3700703 [Mycena olivaceomarginata]
MDERAGCPGPAEEEAETGWDRSRTVVARVLADHFERVILVDPELEDIERPKTRIMQYKRRSCLFADGARRLWPNFDAELKAGGGRLACGDYQMHYSGVSVPAPYWDYPDGCLPTTLAMRRSSAQKALYYLLMQHPVAARITASANKACIESVTVRKLDGEQMTIDDVGLVVDCTGTAQTGIKWLENAGFTLPRDLRSSYAPNIRYSTICFSVSPELESKLPIPNSARNTIASYLYAEHFDYGSKAAVLLQTDNHTMQMLMTSSEDNLPRSRPEIIPFLSTIRGHVPMPSWFLEAVEMLCEHCPEPSYDNIRIPDQSYVKYHSLPSGTLPCNFIAVGDANLQLNPVHGQGFAKVMLNSITLNTLLHSIGSNALPLPRDFSTRYFKTNAARTQGLWDATRLHDYGALTCEPMAGETRDTGRFARWFELKFGFRCLEDVASALWHIRNLIARDRALFAPTVLAKVLWTQSRF